jgi:hypothetical protein
MLNILFTSELHKDTEVRKICNSSIKIFLTFSLYIVHSPLRGLLLLSLRRQICALYKWRIMLSGYITNNRKDTLFSRHYLRKSSAFDIGIVGHIDVNYTNEHFREEWQIISETICIFQMLNGIFVPKLFRTRSSCFSSRTLRVFHYTTSNWVTTYSFCILSNL